MQNILPIDIFLETDKHNDSTSILLSGDWSFADEDTQYATHRFHPYPARMVPQIANRVIRAFTDEGDLVLDPFCGSGTVLLEAKLLGRNSIGIDINPLALIIAKAKTEPPTLEELECLLEELERRVLELSKIPDSELRRAVKIPSFTNIDYWFKDYVIIRLAALRELIIELASKYTERVKYFLYTCFAWTVRLVSNVKKREYKLVRMPEDELRRFNPDVYRDFLAVVKHYVDGVKDYWKIVLSKSSAISAKVDIMFGDSRRIPLNDESVDMIVTSPPYGDSRTTVAYGQFSRLQLCWLGFDEHFVKKLDEISLGGFLDDTRRLELTPTLQEVLRQIASRDPQRALDVKKYFAGLYLSLREMCRVLCRGGVAVIVIANRTVRRVRIPTHQIIRELCEKLGMVHIKTIPRRIVRKRLPWKNAPENIPGLVCDTMAEETIIILRKQ